MSDAPSTGSYTTSHTEGGAPTAGAVAYTGLKDRILQGDVPVGIRLGEERIAERLGVSRTPVREALLRLDAEGFLERHPEGGFRVRPPSAQQMRDRYEIRRALEGFAVRRTAVDLPAARSGRTARSLVEDLREEWRVIDAEVTGPDAEFVLLDEDFHVRLAEASGNAELAGELRRLNERIRPVRSHDFVTEGRIVATVEEHLAVLDAVLAGRPAEAAVLLEEHIVQSQRIVEAAVGRVLERMLAIGERDLSW